MSIEITINVKIKDKEIELTLEELKELKAKIDSILGHYTMSPSTLTRSNTSPSIAYISTSSEESYE